MWICKSRQYVLQGAKSFVSSAVRPRLEIIMIAHGADEIDEYVKYWLSRYQLPGMALVAARNNDLVFEHYWGRANFEDDTPPDLPVIKCSNPYAAIAATIIALHGHRQHPQCHYY